MSEVEKILTLWRSELHRQKNLVQNH